MVPDIANKWIWLGFSIFIIIALGADTFLLRKQHKHIHDSMRVALLWSFTWVVCALIFNALIWVYLYYTANLYMANQVALDFFTGYLIEKTLSIDNLFAFYMIFNQFRIPPAYQHRIFSYGIWSAIIFRLILILLGSWLVTRFHWLIYIMGIFLLLTGIKMFFASKEKNDLYSSWLYQAIKRWFRITDKFDGQKFFVRKPSHAGVPVLYATPLFIALIFIEFSDLVFAFDSIPAIFAITRDPFIVWTSNIFAILGLRALYFLLSGMVTRFHLLKYGIALILVFVGLKMISEPWVHVSVEFSLGVIFIILLSFTVLSIKIKQRKP